MVSSVSGKYCFTEEEVNRFCMRTGEKTEDFSEVGGGRGESCSLLSLRYAW